MGDKTVLQAATSIMETIDEVDFLLKSSYG